VNDYTEGQRSAHRENTQRDQYSSLERSYQRRTTTTPPCGAGKSKRSTRPAGRGIYVKHMRKTENVPASGEGKLRRIAVVLPQVDRTSPTLPAGSSVKKIDGWLAGSYFAA